MLKTPCLMCGGRCCQKFYLYIRNKKTGTIHTIRKDSKSLPKQVRRLTREELRAIFGKVPEDVNRWYTCEWFDAATGRCSHYDERPNFCREFMCSEAIEKMALTSTDAGVNV